MYTVMIVEDDDDQIVLLSGLISSFGYRVLTARSKKEAMSIIDSHVKIDVLFTDFMLGDGTGGEILAEMRERLPRIMTILYTGVTKFPPSLSGGFDDYLTKPVNTSDLRCTIASCLEVRTQRQSDVKKSERAA